MAASNSGQFALQTINGTDYSAYWSKTTPTYRKDSTKVTTFSTGGGRVAEKNVEGAVVSEISTVGPWNKTVALAMMPFVGSRNGTTVTTKGGSNNLPTTGDEQHSGTFSILEVDVSYKFGAPATQTYSWKVPDGASSAPAITTI